MFFVLCGYLVRGDKMELPGGVLLVNVIFLFKRAFWSLCNETIEITVS